MKRSIVCLIVCFLVLEFLAWAGLGSHQAMYVGGTVSELKENTEGTVSTTDDKVFAFDHKGGRLAILYQRVNSLEYGQKAGRRVGLGIAVSPLFLFSKKRRHYVTIGYLDDSQKQQAAVFELGKDVISPVLSSLESKTGKKVEYQDDESRKTATGK